MCLEGYGIGGAEAVTFPTWGSGEVVRSSVIGRTSSREAARTHSDPAGRRALRLRGL